jgi:hypothetical protein
MVWIHIILISDIDFKYMNSWYEVIYTMMYVSYEFVYLLFISWIHIHVVALWIYFKYFIPWISTYYAFTAWFMHMISYPLFAPAEGNPYLNDLVWVIYETTTSSQCSRKWARTRCSRLREASSRRSSPCQFPRGQRVRCRRCAAAVFEGERQQIWRSARSNSTFCAQVSKRLVTYIEALLFLRPYGRPSEMRIVAIADARDLILQH